jgi:hypothetical protein
MAFYFTTSIKVRVIVCDRDLLPPPLPIEIELEDARIRQFGEVESR